MNTGIILNNLIGKGAYWTINKKIAVEIGILPALIIADLISKREYFSARNELDEKGGFYNVMSDLSGDYGKSEDAINKAIEKLISVNFLRKEKKGMPAKNYYYIQDENILEFFEIREQVAVKNSNKLPQNTGTGFRKNPEQVTAKNGTNNNKEITTNNNNRKEEESDPFSFSDATKRFYSETGGTPDKKDSFALNRYIQSNPIDLYSEAITAYKQLVEMGSPSESDFETRSAFMDFKGIPKIGKDKISFAQMLSNSDSIAKVYRQFKKKPPVQSGERFEATEISSKPSDEKLVVDWEKFKNTLVGLFPQTTLNYVNSLEVDIESKKVKGTNNIPGFKKQVVRGIIEKQYGKVEWI